MNKLVVAIFSALAIFRRTAGPIWGRVYFPRTNHEPGCWFLALGLLTLLLMPHKGLAGPLGPGGGPPPLVAVAPITTRDINPPTEYVGHVEAIQTVDLLARVEGFLEQVNFKEGNNVQAGDILYRIEQAPYKAREAAAKAQVGQAEAILEKATRHLKRLRAARPESVPGTDMDDAIAEVLRARAQLEAAKADLETARINLAYTIIKAPITGRIGKTAYTKGNLVNLGSGPLARIVQTDPIRVVYSVSENDIPAIQAACHDAASGKRNYLLSPRIRLANGQLFKESGHVDFVDNEVDPSTGTIAVRAVFNNPDELLIPGQYVTVLVKKSEPRIMPVVPQAAVLMDRRGPYVLVVDSEGRATVRPIVIGPAVDIYWAVKSGLQPGEKVIIQGIQKVRPGQKVRVKAESAQEK